MTETRDLDRKIRFRSMWCIWYLHTAILPHFPFTDHSFLLSPYVRAHSRAFFYCARAYALCVCFAFGMPAHRLFVSVVCFFFFIAIVSFFIIIIIIMCMLFFLLEFFVIVVFSLPKSKHKSHPIEFDSWYYFTFFSTSSFTLILILIS